jgi:hypothetical protein
VYRAGNTHEHRGQFGGERWTKPRFGLPRSRLFGDDQEYTFYSIDSPRSDHVSASTALAIRLPFGAAAWSRGRNKASSPQIRPGTKANTATANKTMLM